MPIYADPDFAALTDHQREAVACSFMCAMTTSAHGVTPLQRTLAHAYAHSLLGLDHDIQKLEDMEPAYLGKVLADVPLETRQRIVQLLLSLELVADPLPQDVVERVEAYACALGVEEGLLAMARDYAGQAYGLALKDLQRKGYFSTWDDHGRVEERMHVHQHLTRPFEVIDHDPVLEAEWKSLENRPAGTLGRLIWEFYIGRGFVFPGGVGSVSPTLAQHDWVHVLADYGTVIESELEVFAFIAAAIPDPKGFSFFAAVIGLFETGRIPEAAGGVLQADPGHLSQPGMATRVADALRRGRICHQDVLHGIDYFEYVDLPIEEARAALSIVPKGDDALSAGSAGVWESAGITAYQREHGDPRFQPRPE